jgi:hypothetical protein
MKKLSIALLAVGVSVSSVAQTTEVTKPSLEAYNNGYIILTISPNGKYTLYENRSEDEKSGGRIVDLETGAETLVISKNPDASGDNGAAADITDDGNIVVGNYEDMPAYWNRTTGIWTQLPITTTLIGTGGAISGNLSAVTADGHYAVGREFYSEYAFEAGMWDLTTNKRVSLSNLPLIDRTGSYQGQNEFRGISADGRYILGVVSYSYYDGLAYYVYDRDTATYQYIGFDYANNKLTSQVDKLNFIDAAVMSPDGNYVTGQAYMSDDNVFAFRYNCKTKEFEIYNTDLDSGITGIAIDNNGNVYGATPVSDPQRYIYIRSGKYWYSMENILSQRYGIDFNSTTGLDYTGTPTAVSGDGRYIGAFSNPEDGNGCNYTFYEDVQTACESVDLMGTYTTSPVSGSCFSVVSTVTLTFDRAVTLLGANNSVQLLKTDGSTVRNSSSVSADGSTVTIKFRSTTLEADQIYTVHVPAGTLAMEGDTDVKSKDIDIKYVGRTNTPVAAGTIYPTPGTAISKLDYNSYVQVSYDTYVKVVDGAKASVYRNDEAEPYEEMSLYVSGKTLAIYPTSTFYFYKDNTYRIVLPAGSVTDAGGSGKNEELTINYVGNYEREVSATDKVLFSEDFSTGLGSQFMFYDGDGNTPTSEMQDYGFDATNTPWWVASDKDDDTYNYAAMSTSSYSPAGTSDDWMVTPSLYIPDETCYISFKTQGFRNSKQDRLSVYVIPSAKVYNTLTTAAMTELKANKISIFNEVVSPGKSEGDLAGDWTTKEISLAAYAGQDVYIAFVNENTDQSIVFVDDVEVIHDMNYLIALDNETTVVNKESINIFGRVSVQTETSTYSSAHLELIDANGNILDTIDETGLTIDKDHAYSFSFKKALPLEVGKETAFKMIVGLGSDRYTVSRTITDLAFEPVKRVLIEEFAGAACQNCPLGILAMEHLEEALPNNFIGVTIRTYENDELSSNLSGYSSYLGFTAAPTGIINRKVLAAPMDEVNGSYVFNNPDSPVWADLVYDELSTPAVADISLSAAVSDDGTTIDIPVTVTYALTKDDVNVSVLFIILEDDIETYQLNKFYTVSDPNLGEWGKGGIYGKSTVRKYHINDVARALDGKTYNGTQGYIPASVTAGTENTFTRQISVPQIVSNLDKARVVAVMIDNNTDQVINAAQCRLVTAGVDDLVANDSNVKVNVNADGDVVVNSDNDAVVSVYGISGALIGNAQGRGSVVAQTNGYNGVAIVRVVTANNTIVNKVIIK